VVRRSDTVNRMRTQLYSQLLAIACRHAGPLAAEDVVQDAMVAAVRAGRMDLANPGTARWLTGVVRNRARMTARSSWRRQMRETRWQADDVAEAERDGHEADQIFAGLSKPLRVVVALALTGHDRREIAHLLSLSDAALRQRIKSLKRHMAHKGLAAPDELRGLHLDLAYGRIRDALSAALKQQDAFLGSHDPDGHLFLVRRSQKG
jgi:DNA-directed RNA polymerase specialized sigma24 family protein